MSRTLSFLREGSEADVLRTHLRSPLHRRLRWLISSSSHTSNPQASLESTSSSCRHEPVSCCLPSIEHSLLPFLSFLPFLL